jgi:hypothetical protein
MATLVAFNATKVAMVASNATMVAMVAEREREGGERVSFRRGGFGW